MPSLVRFILVLALFAALAGAGAVALVAFVHVTPRPMVQSVPPARLK